MRDRNLCYNSGVHNSRQQSLILLAIGLSGLAALGYEVVWVRLFSFIIGSSIYAMSTVLAAYMSGLALGSYLGGLLADRYKQPAFYFALAEIGIAFLALITLPFFTFLPRLYAWIYFNFKLSYNLFFLAQFGLVFLYLFLPTTFMGATFPLALKARTNYLKAPGRESGYVYAANTLGAIIGPLLTGYLLIPQLGSYLATAFLVALNLLIGLSLLVLVSKEKQRVLIALSIAATVLLTSFLALFKPTPTYSFTFFQAQRYKSYEHYLEQANRIKVVAFKESLYGQVGIAENVSGKNKFLINHGKIEGGTSGDVLNQRLLTYLPLAATNFKAKNFLNIGLGTGDTLQTALKNKNLKQIDVVEINPAVKELSSRYFFPRINKDKRVNMIYMDARNYLLLSKKKYNIISSEPSYPTEFVTSNLFTKEFFELVKSRLTKDGVFAQWFPYYLYTDDEAKSAIKTMALVFPYVDIYNVNFSDVIFIARKRDGLKGAQVEKLAKHKIAQEKSQASKTGHFFYVKFSPKIARQLRNDKNLPLNSDFYPFLEFAAVRNFINQPF